VGRKLRGSGTPRRGTGEGVSLGELRQARRLSQEVLAERLGTRQASISKLEGRSDMHLSTLRSYVEALGGTLELIARFPDRDVTIGPAGETGSIVYPGGARRREPTLVHERPGPAIAHGDSKTRGGPTAVRRVESLSELRALRRPILEIALRHGAASLRVFGSAARGELREDSDLDLLVTAGKEVGPWFPGGLAADLGELLGRRVDVVTESSLAPELRQQVMAEAVSL